MKYDFFKFNRKQILKRKLEEKITITRYDLKLFFCYQFSFYLAGSFAGIQIYNLFNKFVGTFIFVGCVGMLAYTLIKMERFDNDN